MRAFYKDKGLRLYMGDCREVMAALPENSVDAIVTDPPYEIGFMGKSWDSKGVAFDVETWKQALRVLKPGGHMVAFGAPRNYHRLAVAIEDAGFEIRDSLMWLFGSGFPKSLDVSKAIDRKNGDTRPIIGAHPSPGSTNIRLAMGDGWQETPFLTSAASAASAAWEGWGTALKPAYEPIVLARKPLGGTVAGNVAQWGTGGLNIDACRIEGGPRPWREAIESDARTHQTLHTKSASPVEDTTKGRWPANVLLDDEAAALLDAMSGESADGIAVQRNRDGGVHNQIYGSYRKPPAEDVGFGSRGGASRFFYTAKASRSEREAGLHDLDPSRRSDGRDKDIENPRLRTNKRRNDHPTVKPVALMRWLCRLITPPNGIILDPFLGSGSTGMAALYENFRFVGIDLEERYIEIAKRRITRRGVEIKEAPDGTAHIKKCRYPTLPCICK